MNRWTVLLVTVLLGTFVAMGCSSGGGNPMAPTTSPELTSGTPNHGASAAQTHLWGYWDVYIDIENQTVEAVDNRSVMFAANVVTFLNSKGGLAFNIIETPVEADWIDVDIDVSLTHPLPGLPMYDGYDVKGVFCSNASGSLEYGGGLDVAMFGTDQFMFDDPDDDDGGGPDGYTRWFNQPEFSTPGVLGYTNGKFASKNYTSNSVVNPYKYFADGLGSDEDLWSWLGSNTDSYGRFASGSTNTRNYYLRFPNDTGVNYGYAVVASWKGEDLDLDHPAPAPEATAADVKVTDAIYYVDNSDWGGDLILDMSFWGWDGSQPSTVYVESDVIGGLVELDAAQMMPVGGDENFSTYHFEMTTTEVTGTEGNEFWVIAEYPDYDYSNEYGVPNNAESEPLAAYFRYPLYIAPEPYCSTEIVSIDPTSAPQDSLVNATITLTEIEDGPSLSAWLSMTGETNIDATNLVVVDPTTLTCDFDLTGATDGLWDLHVRNGCGGAAAVSVEAFEIIKLTGLYIIDDGPLPTPLPTPDFANIDFSVIGSDAFGYQGVYYWAGSGTSYQAYVYPIDYSGAGTLHCTLYDPFFGNVPGLMGGTNYMNIIEASATGYLSWTSAYPGAMTWGGYPGNGPVWWCGPSGTLENGYIYFNMQFHDLEREFSLTGTIWGYWGNNPAGVDGATYLLMPPYGQSNYTSYTGYYPADHTGSVDGMVSDNEAYRCAIDSDPEGLSAPFNCIWYYMEGPPDDYGIEIMENVNNLAFPVSLGTLDSEIVGTPNDISVLNAYGNIDGAEGNWLCVLEDNGDSTWQISVWDQEENLIARYSPALDGDPIALDCDTDNHTIHVWVDNSGYEYYIFGF